MDVYVTLITGIYWGLIIDACWIIPYFALLFYHFYKMENDSAYKMRYENANMRVKKYGVKEAAVRESNVRIIPELLKGIWTVIKNVIMFPVLLFREIKMASRKKAGKK